MSARPGPAAFDRPIVDRLRRTALAFPETTETASFGHPNFRAGKKIFAAFEIIDDRPSIAFRLPKTDVDLLLHKKNFFATPYGRGLWASVWVDPAVNWKLIAPLLKQAYLTVANKRMVAALTTPNANHGTER